MNQKIIGIVAEQLHIKPDGITTESTLESLGADSLDQVEIIMKIEEELNIKIDDAQLENFKNLGQLISHVQKLVQ